MNNSFGGEFNETQTAGCSYGAIQPDSNNLDKKHRTVFDAIREDISTEGISRTILQQKFRHIQKTEINNILDFLISEGHIYSSIDSDHFLVTEFNETQTAGINLDEKHRTVFDAIRAGISRTILQQKFRHIQKTEINNILDFLISKGHIYSSIDSDHFLATEFNETQTAGCNDGAIQPDGIDLDSQRRTVFGAIYENISIEGISRTILQQKFRHIQKTELNNILDFLISEGHIYSYIDSDHFLSTEFNETQTAGCSYGAIHPDCINLNKKHRTVFDAIRENISQEGISRTILQQKFRHIKETKLNHILNFLIYEGHIYSSIDSDHFLVTEFNETQTAGINLDKKHRTVFDAIREDISTEGISRTILQQKFRHIQKTEINNILDFLISEGHIYSYIDSDHFLSTEFNETQTAGCSYGAIHPDCINLNKKHRTVFDAIRKNVSQEGISRTILQQKFYHIQKTELNNILDFLISEGHIYSSIDSDHFLVTEFNETQTVGCNDGAIQPDRIDLDSQRRTVFGAIYENISQEGISRTILQQKFRHIQKTELNNILDFLISEGHIYSSIDSDHFLSTEFNETQTAGCSYGAIHPDCINLDKKHRTVFHAIRENISQEGISRTILQQKFYHIQKTELNNILDFLISEGHIYSSIDSDHFLVTEFNETQTSAGSEWVASEQEIEGIAPVFIKQLIDSGDTKFAMWGMTFGMVCCTSIVRSIQASSTKITYLLEDSTGRIEGHYWLVDGEDAEKLLPDIMLNNYATAYGSLRSHGCQNTLMIYRLIPVKDPNAINTHALEVLNARFKAEYFFRKSDENFGCSDGAVGGVSGSQSTAIDLDSKHRTVFDAIRENISTEGISRTILQQKFRHIQKTELNYILDFLISEGHIFSTIDSDHFMVCEDFYQCHRHA